MLPIESITFEFPAPGNGITMVHDAQKGWGIMAPVGNDFTVISLHEEMLFQAMFFNLAEEGANRFFVRGCRISFDPTFFRPMSKDRRPGDLLITESGISLLVRGDKNRTCPAALTGKPVADSGLAMSATNWCIWVDSEHGKPVHLFEHAGGGD